MAAGMTQESFLTDDFLRQLISVGEVDLLVGITSNEGSNSANRAAQAAEEAVLRNFPRDRAVLINLDGGSKDPGLSEGEELGLIRKGEGRSIESLRTFRRISARSRNVFTVGTSLRTILAAADLSCARACVIIPASAENVVPSWIESLLRPVYREGYDFVAPLYSRHKFDGLLTRNILFPLSRTLFGRAVRELVPTEFAFSGRLAARCLAEGSWNEEALQETGEMWIAIAALLGDYRCCQTFLGPKVRVSAGSSVVSAIRQTVNGMFWSLDSTAPIWLNPPQLSQVHTIGPDQQISGEYVRVDRKKLLAIYRSGIEELSQILGSILSPDTYAELSKLSSTEETTFHLSNPLWVRVVYEFAASYHHSVLNRDHLVQALVPIYRGRVASFLIRHRASNFDEIHADIEDLNQEFERQKNWFFDLWNMKGQGES